MRIYSQDIGIEIDIKKMCNTNNEKRKTTYDGRNRTTKQDKIRTIGEIET